MRVRGNMVWGSREAAWGEVVRTLGGWDPNGQRTEKEEVAQTSAGHLRVCH